ncbi:MAG: DNA primase [Candidatus Paraimprobicoccus trichonymphae]|uniref:DNA primase n=1 Tax=Candidatus Paraimprobicoccus trichonymphae TaxID=3033793 RepID=A0AA48HZE2_9FIRM|nr:MAG: DNA primase [Candidatus Paraimprobicoccus trichonymphae]
MSFPEEFIKELKYKNNIADVVSGFVDLRQSGKYLIGICPFHIEKTASFFVYPNNDSFYCFGCSTGGDVIAFIKLIEKLDYVESVKFLAQKSNLSVPENEFSNEIYKNKCIIYEINRESAKFFHEKLKKSRVALEYLKNRNLNVNIIKKFGIGYSPNSKFELLNHLKHKDYLEKDIILANLAKKTNSGEIVDRFNNRIMFPIIDLKSSIIGFGGRRLDNNKNYAKYLNTSDTLVFKKSGNLFAFNFARKSEKDFFILTEGYMDVISLFQAGFENSVATLGTSLTQEQTKLISRNTDKVTLCYDSDSAGKSATLRAIDLLKSSGIQVKILPLVNSKDPDEFIKTFGVLRFKNLIGNSIPDIDYKLSNLKLNFNLQKPEDKIKYTLEACKILSSIKNAIELDLYSSRLSEEVNIEKSSIKIQIDKNKKSYIKNIELKRSENNLIKLKKPKLEETVLNFIVKNNIFIDLPEDIFKSDFNKKLYKALKDLILENRDLTLDNILSKKFSSDDISKITNIICNFEDNNNIEIIKEYVIKLEQENEREKIKNNKNVTKIELKRYIEKLKKLKK